MGETDWGALAGEVGLPPPPPHPRSELPTVDSSGKAIPYLQPAEAAAQLMQARQNKLPGMKADPRVTGAAVAGYTAPPPPPPPAPEPTSTVDWNALGGEVGISPQSPTESVGQVDWGAMAGEVGMHAPLPATPPVAHGPFGAVGDWLQAHSIQGAPPPDPLVQAMESMKAPASLTLATPQPASMQQEEAKARAEATGQPVMTAQPPGALHNLGAALVDYMAAKARPGIAGADQRVEEAKARLREAVMPIAQAGGTAWNNALSMLQSIPEASQAIADSLGGAMGALTATAAGAAGVPGATPEVAQAELARSRVGTEKALETAHGLARAPVDPWMYLATDREKFRQMIEADPLTTVAMMIPGFEMARRGIALPPGGGGGTVEPSGRPPRSTESPGAPEAAVPAPPSAPPAPEVPIPTAERRTGPPRGPSYDYEASIDNATAVTDPQARKAAVEQASRAFFESVRKRAEAAGIEPDIMFARSDRLRGIADRLHELEMETKGEPAPAPPAAAEALPGQQPGQPGQTPAGAAAGEGPARLETAAAPTLTVAGEQARAGGKPPIRFFTSDQPMPVTGEKAGTRVTEEVLRKNGLEPPVPAGPVEHAIGESLRYGKQRVVVKEAIRNADGELVGYRVKGKYDRAPFVIKPAEAKPWGDIVSKRVPGRAKIGELRPEDLGTPEVVARFLDENGGLRESGETKDLGQHWRSKGVMGVVRKGGLEIDAMAERLADGGAFPDKDAAAEWLNNWVYGGGDEAPGPLETRFLERAGDQGGRFGVEVPARRARLASIGRDLNKLVVNPREGQKGSLKVGDVVMTDEDVFRVKPDTKNPGKLMLKDGRTIRPAAGETVRGVKLGKMPFRTREELKAAGRPVPKERYEGAEPAAEPATSPPGPDKYAEIKARVKDLHELESLVTAGPAEEGPKGKGKRRLLDEMASERRAIETDFAAIDKIDGRETGDRIRQEAGWNPRDEDVLAEARRRTEEAAAKAKRLAEQDKLRAKGVKQGQRSLTDEEQNAEIGQETKGREYEREFKKGERRLTGEDEVPFYPNATESVTRASERPGVPLEKNLRPKRGEAVMRAQDIKRRLERIVLAPIRYGVGMKQARGFFRLAERVIRTKKYLDLPVDFHEAGHALQEILFPEIDLLKGKKGFDIKGPNSKAMRRELTALGKELYGERKPVTGYKSEGLAEFTRLYIEDRAKAQEKAPTFFDEFKSRLLQDADTIEIGRVLDESEKAYDLYRKQPSVARALAMMSIGESKPRRWSLDRINSAVFDSQRFIESMVRALNGGLRPEFDLGNPITHAHLLRGWTGLAENALRKGGGVADFKTSGTFEKTGPSVSDIVSKPGVADRPLPFVNEAVATYEKLSPAERLLKRMTNKFEDAKNMRGLDSLRAYWYARRTLSIAEGDVARAYAKKTNVSDAVAMRYVQQHDLASRKGAAYRATGLSFTDARQVVKDLETSALKQAVEDLTTYSNNVLRWYVHEGMWTAEQYRRVVEHPANLVYMPLDRWFSEYGDRGKGTGGREITGARPEVGFLKGNDAPVVDPFETMVANTFLTAQNVQRNRAMRSLVEYAEARPGSGWASELVGKPVFATKFRLAEIQPQIDQLVRAAGGDPDTLPPEIYDSLARIFRPAMEPRAGRNIATYFSKGKEKWAEMDPDVYRAVSGMDQESMPKFIKIFGAPARWLRTGATITPDFLFANFFRDPITSAVLSETGAINPFTGSVPFVTTIKGMRALLKNGDEAFRYRASGAAHAATMSMDRNFLRGQARELLSDTSRLARISGVFLHPWDHLQALGELVESGTRIGTQMAELANTAMSHDDILRGAIKSREGTTDFQRYGSATEPAARLIPFLNPGVQSVRRFNIVTGRAVADVVDSVRALAGGELRAPKYAARYASRVLTYVVAPSVILHFLRKEMGREDEYGELPAWRRHLTWSIPLPEGAAKRWGVRWVHVPKPFEVGVLYGTGTEVMLEHMEKNDPKALAEYQDSLIGAFMPNVIPSFMAGAVENAANRKLAFDRPIMPESQKGLAARQQYGIYTSESAKVIAEGARHLPSLVGKPLAFVVKLGGDQKDINAYDIDNLVQDLTGGLGRNYVTPPLDFVIRRIMAGTAEGERLGIGRGDVTKLRPSDFPILRRLVPRSTEPGSGLLERTYQDIGDSDKAWNTYMDLEGWQRDEFLNEPGNRRLIVGHEKLAAVQKTLATINKLTLKARKEGDDEMVDHLRELAIDTARNAPKGIDDALKDPTAGRAIAIDWELHKIRSEDNARHAEAATVLEAFVEKDADDEKIRRYLEGMEPVDRQWATRYVRALRVAAKLSAEREAAKGASHREKFKLKQLGMLP